MRTLALLVSLILFSATALAQIANHVVISEVYGGGGNSGSYYKNDFIELYNPTSSVVDLTGWSVQYASSAGSNWYVTELNGTIPAYGFYLVQERAGSGGTLDLPVPDAAGATAMNTTDGKVALVHSVAPLSDSIPSPSSYVDLLGYGNATGFEGTGPAPKPGNETSVERKAQPSSTAASMASGGDDATFGNGCDTDNNANDFVAQSDINPQNSSSPTEKLTDSSLPVMMRGTSAKVEGSKVILTFSTASEVDVLGFNIFRAPESVGPYDLISGYASNPALKAAGENNAGAVYSFVDAKVIPGHTYYYRIESADKSGKSGQAGDILAVSIGGPDAFEVFQNFPNPFNPSTTITYSIPSASSGRVILRVYNVTGQEVAVLVDGEQSAGVHSVVFDGGKFASGIYFYSLEAASGNNEQYSAIRKMILVK